MHKTPLSKSDHHYRKRPMSSSWNRWSWGGQESISSDDATDGGSLYHVLDDSGRDGECKCLDVSDSKRLSLMDVLKKDELSFKTSLGGNS